MARVVLGVLVGSVLIGAGAAKLAARRQAMAGIANLAIGGPRAAPFLLGAAVAAEIACGAGAIAGVRGALFAAAALLLATAAVLARARARGRGGLPCGCFGARGRISGWAVARNLLLAVAALAAALAPGGSPSRETAEIAAICALALLVAGLVVGMLALAREVGALRIELAAMRLRTDGRPALELSGEGPELGSRHSIERWFEVPAGGLALAAFTSDGCPLCTGVGPMLDHLGRTEGLAVAELDEHRDADAWAAFDVPGSPYAVALDAEGAVLAKGTFNGLGQLESVVATARRRARDAAGA